MKYAQHKAIVLDMGGVLTLEQDTSCFKELALEFGLSISQLLDLMARYRTEYDAGALSPQDYWRKVIADMCAASPEAYLKEMDAEEAFMHYFEWGYSADYLSWSRERKELHLLAQEVLAQTGKVGIISNMPLTLDDHFIQTWTWLEKVPVAVYSGRVRMLKPNQEIFGHFVEKSGWKPEELLFVDDRAENVEAAQTAGWQALHFTGSPADLETIKAWLAG